MEQHKFCLQNLCRVCGKKPKCYFHDKNSNNCRGALGSVLSVAAGEKDENIYPPKICNHCYLTLIQLKKSKEGGRFRETALAPHTWLPHGNSCEICGFATSPSVSRGRLLLACPSGCGEVLELDQLSQHLASNCSITPVPPPSKISVQQLLELESSTSWLRTHTMGLLAEEMIPSSGVATCRWKGTS